MDIALKCVLHLGAYDPKEKVIAFTEESLKICTEKKELRDRAKKKRSKFDVISLPTQVDLVSGYHAQCYKYFISISEKKIQERTRLPVDEQQQISQDSLPLPNISQNDRPLSSTFCFILRMIFFLNSATLFTGTTPLPEDISSRGGQGFFAQTTILLVFEK